MANLASECKKFQEADTTASCQRWSGKVVEQTRSGEQRCISDSAIYGSQCVGLRWLEEKWTRMAEMDCRLSSATVVCGNGRQATRSGFATVTGLMNHRMRNLEERGFIESSVRQSVATRVHIALQHPFVHAKC
ncbi:hypothetical protein KCU93_g237, partial [Aureobasidium melanogenum]